MGRTTAEINVVTGRTNVMDVTVGAARATAGADRQCGGVTAGEVPGNGRATVLGRGVVSARVMDLLAADLARAAMSLPAAVDSVLECVVVLEAAAPVMVLGQWLAADSGAVVDLPAQVREAAAQSWRRFRAG